MPNEDVEKLDTILAEIEQIDTEIAREKKVIELASEDPKAQQEALLNAATRDPSKQSDETKALRTFLTGGVSALSDVQRSVMLQRQTPEIRATLTTTNSSEGGYTVAPEFMRQLTIAMRAYGAMRNAATVIQSATGASMNFPMTDPTSDEGEILGQNLPAAASDPLFSNVAIEVYKYSSKSIAIPFELVQDSFIDLEAYIRDLLAMRVGRITNRHFTNGTGVGEPRGVVNWVNAGKVGATGQTTTVTYDDLIDLEHSVDPAYRTQEGVAFMMSDSALKVVRKIKDSQGRPIFNPGYEVGIPGGAPDTIFNRPIIVNTQMPDMAANAKSILFGLFRRYIIRDVMDFTLFRMTDSAFTLRGQIGFVGFMRCGGAPVDPGGAIRYYQNSAT
jgi:HK97 family phage major capsid protein